MFAKDAEINHVSVVKKLNEILAARGKKGTDRSEQIELLQELLNIAKLHDLGPAIYVKVMLAIVASIFDYNPNIATCMRTEMWNKCVLRYHIRVTGIIAFLVCDLPLRFIGQMYRMCVSPFNGSD